MPRPTEAAKRICYADDITLWASGVKILELENTINGYLTEMSCFLRDNSLLISAPKLIVTLFTPDQKQTNTNPKIKISAAELPLVRNPKLLGVYLDTFFSFNTHCVQVTNRLSKINNVLKAFAGTNWGQQKETLLLTYKTLGRSIANYVAPVWSTNASDTSLGRIQRTQNEALKIITASHKYWPPSQWDQDATGRGPPESSPCAISDTLSRHRECLSLHHYDGSSTEGNERDTFH